MNIDHRTPDLPLSATLEKVVLAEIHPSSKCLRFRYTVYTTTGGGILLISVLEFSQFTTDGLRERVMLELPLEGATEWESETVTIPAMHVLKVRL